MSANLYVRGTIAMNTVQYRNKDDKDKVTKKKRKSSSGRNKGSTRTKKTKTAKKKNVVGSAATQVAEEKLLAKAPKEVEKRNMAVAKTMKLKK